LDFALEIAGLLRMNNLEKISFSSGMLAILPLLLTLQTFFCYFYNALDMVAPKIKFLA